MTKRLPASLPGWLGEVTGDVVFATVSGAHLYGFPSVDSDVDLRGVIRTQSSISTSVIHTIVERRER